MQLKVYFNDYDYDDDDKYDGFTKLSTYSTIMMMVMDMMVTMVPQHIPTWQNPTTVEHGGTLSPAYEKA